MKHWPCHPHFASRLQIDYSLKWTRIYPDSKTNKRINYLPHKATAKGMTWSFCLSLTHHYHVPKKTNPHHQEGIKCCPNWFYLTEWCQLDKKCSGEISPTAKNVSGSNLPHHFIFGVKELKLFTPTVIWFPNDLEIQICKKFKINIFNQCFCKLKSCENWHLTI